MEEIELEEIEEESSTSLNATPKATESQSKKSRYPWRSHFFEKVSLASLSFANRNCKLFTV
jgi:hypothetical protein